MRKTICFLFFTFVCLQAYPFWIWSPKTQEWKNPKHSALATPTLQYQQAVEFFEIGEFKRAHDEFNKLLVNYPDSREAPEAQYYLGRSLEELDKPYQAYLAYQKIIQSYPNSVRIGEAIERQYNIGEYFLKREPWKVFGISIYDFVEHPSIRIFKSIVEESPYSDYAVRAQYKLGMIFLELGHFEKARLAFQKVLDNYPESRWAEPAKYQAALATAKVFPGADYDSRYLESASEKLDQFIQAHPEAQISEEARGQLAQLRNKEAEKIFETAEFYLRRNRPESARVYLSRIINQFSDTEYYQKAKEKIAIIESP